MFMDNLTTVNILLILFSVTYFMFLLMFVVYNYRQTKKMKTQQPELPFKRVVNE